MEHSPPSHEDEGPPMMTLHRLRQLLDAYGATLNGGRRRNAPPP